MKKVLVMLLVLSMMMVTVTGCSMKSSTNASSDTTAEKEKPETIEGMTVGYCMPDTSESFLANLSNDVKEKFAADGVKVDIANAAGDSTTQISQIENFATSGTDLIIVMAVDPTGVGDVIKRAQDAGSMVLVAGSDPGVYDALMYTEQYKDGQMIAEMGAKWVDSTFPDAEKESIEIAILEDRSTPEANDRCDGIQTIADINDKIKVVQTVGSIKNNDTAQAAMENIMQTNPNIKMVLSYNSSGAMGVNEFAMRSGSPITDPSKFAVFCSDFDPAAIAQIADSASDKTILRGLVKFGSNDLAGDTYTLAKKMISGESFDAKNPDPLTTITIENVADFQ